MESVVNDLQGFYGEIARIKQVVSYRKAFGGTIRRTIPKIGRNDPCPCGSGKKFKKCCLR